MAQGRKIIPRTTARLRRCPTPEPAQANPLSWYLGPQGGVHSEREQIRCGGAMSGCKWSCMPVCGIKSGPRRASRPVRASQADGRGSTQSGRSRPQSSHPTPPMAPDAKPGSAIEARPGESPLSRPIGPMSGVIRTDVKKTDATAFRPAKRRTR